MLYAYTRVSKKEQDQDRQTLALKEHFPGLDVNNIFSDKISGSGTKRRDSFDRPEYTRLKSVLQAGDEVAIHELDRLGRNKYDVLNEIKWYKDNGIRLRILNIPTTLYELPETTAWVSDMVNNLLFEVYSSIAEQEREQIIKRTMEGMRAAAAKGRRAGRPKLDSEKMEMAIELYNLDEYSVAAICEKFGISRASFYKYMNQKKEDHEE